MGFGTLLKRGNKRSILLDPRFLFSFSKEKIKDKIHAKDMKSYQNSNPEKSNGRMFQINN